MVHPKGGMKVDWSHRILGSWSCAALPPSNIPHRRAGRGLGGGRRRHVSLSHKIEKKKPSPVVLASLLGAALNAVVKPGVSAAGAPANVAPAVHWVPVWPQRELDAALKNTTRARGIQFGPPAEGPSANGIRLTGCFGGRVLGNVVRCWSIRQWPEAVRSPA